MSEHLVQWQHIDLRLDGQRLETLVATQVKRSGAPITDLRLDFVPGEIRAHGRLHKFVAVPFQVSVTLIEPVAPRLLRVVLERASAFGVPLPTLLIGLVESKMPNLVRWDPASGSILVDLDQILPSFVDAEVVAVTLVEGSVIVSLGAGGADLPPGILEGLNGAGHPRS